MSESPAAPQRSPLQDLGAALPAFGSAEPVPPELGSYLDFYRLALLVERVGSGYHCGRLDSGDFRLVVQRWLQPGARHNLLLLHGYFDHVGLFGRLVDYGLSRGCNVLAFDLPGHGLSSGEPASINTFDHYGDSIAAVLAQAGLPPLPLWVMAQSTGAAALINFVRRNPWPGVGTVLLAPLLRPVHWSRVRVSHTLLHRFIDSVPRRFGENSSDTDFLAFVQEDPLQPRRIPVDWVGALSNWLAELPLEDLGTGPALIVQGDKDGTVDWRYNLPHIGKLVPNSSSQMVRGAGHHLANEAEGYRQLYQRAVDRYLGLDLCPPAYPLSWG
ncbi:MAG: alpha/beta hydrolase [Parahaliea sp.]